MRSAAVTTRALVVIVLSWPLAYVAFSYVGVAGQAARGQGCTTSGRPVPFFPSRLCYGSRDERVLSVVLACCVLALLVGVLLLAVRWILQPLGRITEAVSSLGPGSAGVRLTPTGRSRGEAARLALAIDAMLDRFHHGYEAQRRFAANASHELRTPLATQRTLVEVGLASPLTEERGRLLAEQLLATNQRNEALIEGLLALAETDQGLLERVPQRLDRVVGAVVEEHRELAVSRGLDLRCDLEDVTVVGEAPLLERLASNLVENALKYNQPEGWVTVLVSSPGTLTVTNSGPVLEPGQTSGLFEPFRRIKGERLDHSSGAGLGLTIVRSIVAAHQGSVSARARPEGGLVVTATLPVSDAQHDEARRSGRDRRSG